MIKKILPLCLIAALTVQVAANEFRFHHENVLGTSLELTINVKSQQDASRLEAIALKELDRLESMLSEYRPESELSRLLSTPSGKSVEVSSEIEELLLSADAHRRATGGAFTLHAPAIKQLWQASTSVAGPSADQRASLSKSIQSPAFKISDRGATRLTDLPISLNGIAKGFVIDKVCAAVAAHLGNESSFTINVGGDIRSIGNSPVTVDITNPLQAFENAEPIQTVRKSGPFAIATSGTYHRKDIAKGHEINHIYDPRTAAPITGTCSTTVIAHDATSADAVATAISAMPVDVAIAWVNDRSSYACLIVDANGKVHRSARWPGAEAASAIKLVADAKIPKDGLHVWFTLNRPEGRRYRRPYVAVWLEDKDGFPVKTSVLWIQTSQPGPRWHRDLTRWYRNDRMRKLVEKTNMIGTVSNATRGPGNYQAHFDGTDNAGKPLPAGEYVLCLEAAREHGTYKILREKISWGTEAIEKKELKGNVEISKASYQFSPIVE